MKADLIKTIEDLYQFIEERQEFTGANIWGWFKVSAKEYLQAGARNYIVCISDGYLYLNNDYLDTLPKKGNQTAVIRHSVVEKFSRDPDWETEFIREGYGLLPIEEDFSSYNVKFLMVEVGLPVLKVKDLPILEKYWRPWLADMGIPDADFLHTQDDPQVAINKIKEFLTTATITE